MSTETAPSRQDAVSIKTCNALQQLLSAAETTRVNVVCVHLTAKTYGTLPHTAVHPDRAVVAVNVDR